MLPPGLIQLPWLPTGGRLSRTHVDTNFGIGPAEQNSDHLSEVDRADGRI